jgi:hypothetical protein
MREESNLDSKRFGAGQPIDDRKVNASGGGRMTRDKSAQGQHERSLKPREKELNRLLIEEFYNDSVARYGTDSEQARVLSRVLCASEVHAPERSE